MTKKLVISSATLLLLLLLFLRPSWSSAALSDAGGGGGLPPCLKTLQPCIPFLTSPAKPNPSCCIPLKSAMENDVDCLCDLFSNQDLLKTLNVTQEEVLGLPPRCGLEMPDLGKCKNSNSTVPAPPPSNQTKSPATPPSSQGPSLSAITVGKSMITIVCLLTIDVVSYATTMF